MPYREYPRVSETASVLRYYAANIESGCIEPPPPHLPPVDQIVGVLRFIAMTFDKEVGEQEGELRLAPQMEATESAHGRFAQLVMKRRNENLTYDSESGEVGGASAAVVMRSGPGYRRRRAP